MSRGRAWHPLTSLPELDSVLGERLVGAPDIAMASSDTPNLPWILDAVKEDGVGSFLSCNLGVTFYTRLEQLIRIWDTKV